MILSVGGLPKIRKVMQRDLRSILDLERTNDKSTNGELYTLFGIGIPIEHIDVLRQRIRAVAGYSRDQHFASRLATL
jgi:hypothetical protein